MLQPSGDRVARFRDDGFLIVDRILGRLMGWPGTRIMIDNVLWKHVGARSLGFHQDSAYLRWFRPRDLCSLWMARDDTSAEGGAMELVRGSHKWRRSYPEGEFHGPEDYPRTHGASRRRAGVEHDVVNDSDRDFAFVEVELKSA